MTEPLLEVKGLKTWFQVGDQRAWAVGGVSFEVMPGEFLGSCEMRTYHGFRADISRLNCLQVRCHRIIIIDVKS